MKVGTYEVHEACQLFPLLDDEELEKLAEDIKTNGLLHPIVLHEEKVLDGRNRLLACEKVGISPRFEQAPKGDAVAYVLSTNLHRRHLTPSQAAMVAAKAVPMLAKEAKRRQREGSARGGKAPRRKADANLHQPSADLEGRAHVRAAELTNVSPRSVANALKVKKHGAPEVVAAVERGDVAVSAAAAIVDRPFEDQQAWLASQGAPAPEPERKPPRPSGRQPEDGVGGVMTRLRLTWRQITPARRRDLIQVLKVFLQMHEGKEDVE